MRGAAVDFGFSRDVEKGRKVMHKDNDGQQLRDEIARDWKQSDYYERAEHSVAQFWDERGHFRPMFAQLNLAHVLELACGHGRHVPHYLGRADRITLVDVNEENISFCRNRFQDEKISFLRNDGRSLEGIEDKSVTGIFCYDAMVHFELFDVYFYLQEASRVLTPGGFVLLHHSNYTGEPENKYKSNPHWRNFMSAEIFRYLASRSGLVTTSQRKIDWGSRRKHIALDCVSLAQKPADDEVA
jgi:ubiquinone/menaquinone biosynthesis C-methylase UbiE